MNERIEKLAKQAEEDTRIKHVNAYWQMADELAEDATWRAKFAELVAKECLVMCTQHFAGAVGTHAGAHNSAVKKCADSIRERFGVE